MCSQKQIHITKHLSIQILHQNHNAFIRHQIYIVQYICYIDLQIKDLCTFWNSKCAKKCHLDLETATRAQICSDTSHRSLCFSKLELKNMINYKFQYRKKYLSGMSQKFFPQLKCLHNILISILSKAPGALDKIFAGWPIPINDTLKHRESNGTLAVTQQIPVGKWKHIKLLNFTGFEAIKRGNCKFGIFVSFKFIMRLWGKPGPLTTWASQAFQSPPFFAIDAHSLEENNSMHLLSVTMASCKWKFIGIPYKNESLFFYHC